MIQNMHDAYEKCTFHMHHCKNSPVLGLILIQETLCVYDFL